MADTVTIALGIDASGARQGADQFASAADRVADAGRRASASADNLKQSMSEGQRVYEQTRTRAEAYASELQRLAGLHRAGAISADTYARALARTKTEFADVSREATGMSRSISASRAAIAGFAGGLGAMVSGDVLAFFARLPRQILEIGDAYNRLQQRLVSITGSTDAAATAQRDLFDIAQRSGASFQDTAALFTRLSTATRDMGVSYEDITAVVDSFSKTLALSGANTTEATSATQQFAQAMGSGVMQGEEFKAVLEASPRTIQAIADGLGISIGALREWSRAGELTTETIIRAFRNQRDQIDADVRAIGDSLSQAANRVINAWEQILSQLDKTQGSSGAARDALNALAQWMQGPGIGAAVAFADSFATIVSAMIQAENQARSVRDTFLNVFDAIQGLRKLTPFAAIAGAGTPSAASVSSMIGAPSVPPPVTSADYGGDKRPVHETVADLGWSEYRTRQMPRPAARPTGMIEFPQAPRARAGGGRRRAGGGAAAAREPRMSDFEFGKPFEAEISSLEQRSQDALTSTQRATQEMLQRITEAHTRAFGDQARLIEMRRDKELDELRRSAASQEDRARARVQIEEVASREIMELRRREAEETRRYEEEYLQTQAQYAFGDERKRLQRQLVEMRRDAEIEAIARSNVSQEQKDIRTGFAWSTAQQQIDVIDPTAWDQAARTLQEFGEGLTSVEGMTQGVIQGLASIGATASSAFADAIVSGESFSDVLESLAVSMQKMIIQMTMQMAIQQALGAGAMALGGWMAGPQGGAATGGQQYGAMSTTNSYGLMLAKGGVVKSEIQPGIYTHPRYFEISEPGTVRMAKGMGLLGEAGPEAVLPLRRRDDGRLGVEAYSDERRRREILPVARLRSGNLGIVAPQIPAPTVGSTNEGHSSVRSIAPRSSQGPLSTFAQGGMTPEASAVSDGAARGMGLLDEAGPEAVLPLRKMSDGRLGVEAYRDADRRQEVLPVARMRSGNLGILPASSAEPPVGGSAELRPGIYHSPRRFAIDSPPFRAATGRFEESSSEAILPMRPDGRGQLGIEVAANKDIAIAPVIRDAGKFIVRMPASAASGTQTRFATGGIIGALPAPGIYARPTYFETRSPGIQALQYGGVVTRPRKQPQQPEPLPNVPAPYGGSGDGSTVNVIINNNSSAKVQQETHERPDGNKDIILTLADQVENIVAARMQRSGTRVNRAVGTVGQTVAR